MADSKQRGGHTVHVEKPPRRLLGNLLIDGHDGQCAYVYAGIAERCPNDAAAHTFIERGGESTRVEMCAEHAREDVPEPPTTEQKELVPDGGSIQDDIDQIVDEIKEFAESIENAEQWRILLPDADYDSVKDRLDTENLGGARYEGIALCYARYHDEPRVEYRTDLSEHLRSVDTDTNRQGGDS